MSKPITSLQERIASGKPLLIAEISPPRGADPAPVREMAKRFAGKVHALGISDNRDRVSMAALAAASLVAAEGVEPILHVTTRDRNRIALVSEALGAQALGIRNLLCTSGSHQTLGRFRAAKNVYDIDSIQLLQTYADLAGECGLVGEDGIDGRRSVLPGRRGLARRRSARIAGVALAEEDGRGGRVSDHAADLRPGAFRRLVERGDAARHPREGRHPGRHSAAGARGTGRGAGRQATSLQNPGRVDRPRWRRRAIPRPQRAAAIEIAVETIEQLSRCKRAARFRRLRRRRQRRRAGRSSRNRDWGATSRACQVRHPYQAGRAPLAPRGQAGDRRLARRLLELPQLRQAGLHLRAVPRRGRHAPRRNRLPRLHLPVQGLPELRAELHEEHPHPRGQSRVPPAGRRLLSRRTSSSPRGFRRRRAGFRCRGRATAGRSAGRASIRCGPTCRKSSGPRATASTAASTSAPASTSAASCRVWRSPTASWPSRRRR